MENRYFAVTLAAFDPENRPVMILVPVKVTNGKYVNAQEVRIAASNENPGFSFFHIVNVTEIESEDDFLDFIFKKKKEKIPSENILQYTETIKPQNELPFFDYFKTTTGKERRNCWFCNKKEIDPEYNPYCSELCKMKDS